MFQDQNNKKKGALKAMSLPNIYTIDEASEILKLKVSKLRKAIFRKEINYVKLGGLVRFREQDLAHYIDQNLISRP